MSEQQPPNEPQDQQPEDDDANIVGAVFTNSDSIVADVVRFLQRQGLEIRDDDD